MISKLRALKKNELFKNVLILASGAAFANAITMLFSMVITRIYGPDEYGYLGIFTSMVYLVAPPIALTLPMAIVIAKEHSEALAMAKLSFVALTLLSILLGVNLTLFGETIFATLNAEPLLPFAWVIPTAVFIAGLFQIAEQWIIRFKKFTVLAKSLTIRSTLVGTVQSLIGLLHPKGVVLVLVYTAGMAIQILFIFRSAPKVAFEKSPFKLLALLKRYSDFPLFRAPQVLLNSISLSAPTLMFATFFGPAVAGLYAIGYNVLTVPVTLLGKSVGDVFYPEIVERFHKGEVVTSVLWRATKTLLLVGIIPFGSIIILGPWVFELLFGAGWGVSGEYAQWISVWLYASLAARPAISAIAIFNLQKQFLVYEILSIALRISAIYMGVIYGDPLIAVALLSVVNAALYFILIGVVLYRSKQVTGSPEVESALCES